MKVSGEQFLAISQERTYALLLDPVILAKCIPGCESLDRVADNEYAMKMKMVLASISGQFQGKVKITDANPPTSFKMLVDGSGKIGFVKGEGVLNLSTAGDGTSVQYEGDVQVGGTMAAVGQRLLGTVTRVLIAEFFRGLERRVAPRAGLAMPRWVAMLLALVRRKSS